MDVIAADGTAVYAVESGIAQAGGSGYDRYVIVGSFGYWHLAGAVPAGTRVRAFQTVIGRVFPGQGHVHLTRFDLGGVAPVNPLVAGGLTPYADTAGPVIGELVAYDPSGLRVPLSSLYGPVALAVRAADVQSLGGTRTGLYTLRYRILGPGGVSVVGPLEVVRFDALPSTQTGDVIYTLASTRHRSEADFWYRITDRTPSADGFLHLERFRPGAYRLLVTAGDARGNIARKTFALRVVRGP